jgi:hypothetical protein
VFEFELLPEVALPPVVLPETFADPELLPCTFTLVTVALLDWLLVQFLVVLLIIWLFEPGPVLLICAEAVPASPSTPITVTNIALMNCFIILLPYT